MNGVGDKTVIMTLSLGITGLIIEVNLNDGAGHSAS